MNWAHPVTPPAPRLLQITSALLFSSVYRASLWEASADTSLPFPASDPPWVTRRELVCPGAAMSTGVALVP